MNSRGHVEIVGLNGPEAYLQSLESDVAPKAGSAQPAANRGARRNQEETEIEEANELWYKVRLPPAVSPAPAGWIYGKQVELAVPSDIIFYRTGREFVAWQRLDGSPSDAEGSLTDKNAGKEARPGSWIILGKRPTRRALLRPDFDRTIL